MTCTCATEADKRLAELNTCIDFATLIGPKGKVTDRIAVRTIKLDPKKRKGPSVLVASYCPFCGVALEKIP
jgi:hypothetical protein